MDTFMDSSWYYLRYLDPHNQSIPFHPSLTSQYLPVHLYIGGMEHAAVHLLYARWIYLFLQKQGLVLPDGPPFKRLLTQGMVRGLTFVHPESGKFIKQQDTYQDEEGKWCLKSNPKIELNTYFDKMSKSKHNGINPLEVIDKWGIDAVRLAILTGSNPSDSKDWSEEDVKWCRILIHRMYRLVFRLIDSRPPVDPKLGGQERERTEVEVKAKNIKNNHIATATNLLENTLSLNSLVASLNSMVSHLLYYEDEELNGNKEWTLAVRTVLLLAHPLAPHITAELWAAANIYSKELFDGNIWEQPWPKVDGDADAVVPMKIFLSSVRFKRQLRIVCEKKEAASMTSTRALNKVINSPNRLHRIFLMGTDILDYRLSKDSEENPVLEIFCEQIQANK